VPPFFLFPFDVVGPTDRREDKSQSPGGRSPFLSPSPSRKEKARGVLAGHDSPPFPTLFPFREEEEKKDFGKGLGASLPFLFSPFFFLLPVGDVWKTR